MNFVMHIIVQGMRKHIQWSIEKIQILHYCLYCNTPSTIYMVSQDHVDQRISILYMKFWTRKTPRSTRTVSHQDPFLMRHGSQPTANRPSHLVASYDMQGGAEDVFYPDVPTEWGTGK